jgi:endonuclease YncB( thermonuclease family)
MNPDAAREVIRAAGSRVSCFMRTLARLLIPLFGLCAAASAAEISSYAFVGHDGTLRVDGRTIHLYGIHIPPTEDNCRTNERPVRCTSRAAQALEFKIAGFVRCEPTARHDDGSVTALCRADGEDLSAYLLRRGWALALPDAPFEYVALERIAQQRNVGVWGISVDRIPRGRR